MIPIRVLLWVRRWDNSSNRNQRQVYNTQKRVHALKFQIVVLHNGMIGNRADPYEGRRNDSFMLADSSLLQQLQQHAWFHITNLYVSMGDLAYPISVYLQSLFSGANLNDAQDQYNQAMSSVRVSVEWMFGLVSNYFKFVDFRKVQRIGVSAVEKVYIAWSILQNAHTCLYGNLISETFNLEPPHIQDYFH